MVLIFFLDWFGVLFIRQGIYQEGVFKFDLNIPENYPDGDCPVGVKLVPENCVISTTGGHTYLIDFLDIDASLLPNNELFVTFNILIQLHLKKHPQSQ